MVNEKRKGTPRIICRGSSSGTFVIFVAVREPYEFSRQWEKGFSMKSNRRFFYGWVIVVTAVFSTMLVYGIRHSFSIFFASILDEFGWSRGSTAFMFSLSVLIYGFVAPLAGSLGDRWKPRKVMPLGLCILGLATASCGFADRLWHFYVLFGFLVPLGMACCGWPLLAPAISNWFLRRRGLAMAIGQAGAGLSFCYGMVAELAISLLGWRYAYLALAGILVAVMLPVYTLFFHYRPEDKGLSAYGDEGSPDEKGDREGKAIEGDSASRGWSMGKAMKTHQLWLLILSIFCYHGLGNYLVLAHQVKFVADAGYSSIFAASVFAMFGIFMTAGQLSSFISDWIGREATVLFATSLEIIALIALISVRDTSRPLLLYVYSSCFGYGCGLYAPTIFVGAADIFHGRHFGAISGLLLTGMGVGGAIGPWFGGYIHDISGSYNMAFSLSLVSFAIASLTFFFAAPRNAARLQAKMSLLV
jgi:sugar phosphate permease